MNYKNKTITAFVMMFFLLAVNLYQPISISSKSNSEACSNPYTHQLSSFPTIKAINNSIIQTSIKGNESLAVTGPINSTIKEIQVQNISINATKDYFKDAQTSWSSIGDISSQKQSNNTALNVTISGINDTVVFNPFYYNNSREAFFGLNNSKWIKYINDSDGSLGYEYPIIWTNNTPSSGAILKKFDTSSLFGASKSCFIELQFPFQYNSSYQYYSGELSFWYSINFDEIANLTEFVNTSVVLSKPSSQNVSLDGWSAQYYSNVSGDVNWQFKNFSFDALNSTLDETGNYILIFRTEISHIRNGTNLVPGITRYYLDEITFFMNFTAKQLQQNQTTGLRKQISIDRAVQGNLTISGFYFTNTLVSSTLNQNFSIFATIHNISQFIANLSQNMAAPQSFSFQINFSTIAPIFNVSFLLVVQNPNPPIILPNETTLIQFFNLSLVANTIPTTSQINCSLIDSESNLPRNLTQISEFPTRYHAFLNFSSQPPLSNPGLQIMFLVNETEVQFNFILNISYYSIQDTIFNQYYEIFEVMKQYLATLDRFVRETTYNQTAVSVFEPYFKLLQQNRTAQALRTLYEHTVSDAYVIHRYLYFLQDYISLSQWYDYVFYDLGIEEFLSVRIRGISTALDDILFTIYNMINQGRADVVPARLEDLYNVVSLVNLDASQGCMGPALENLRSLFGDHPIAPMQPANLSLSYAQNLASFRSNKIITEFINLDSNRGVPSLFANAEVINAVASREFLEISADAGQLISYLYMIYSMKTVDMSLIRIANVLKSLYSAELLDLPTISGNLAVNQWDLNYSNGILKSFIDFASNSTAQGSKASLGLFYPLDSDLYCFGEYTFNVTEVGIQTSMEINLTVPETMFVMMMNNGNNRTIIPHLIRLTLFNEGGPINYWKNITAISNLTIFDSPLNLDSLEKINKTVVLPSQNSTINYMVFRANRLMFAFQQKILLPQFQREITHQTIIPINIYSNQQVFIDRITLGRNEQPDSSIIIDSVLKDRFNDPIFIGTELSNIPVTYRLSIPQDLDAIKISLNITLVENQSLLELSVPIEFEYYYLDQEPPVYLNTVILAIVFSGIIAGLSIVVLRLFKTIYLEYYIRKRRQEAMDRF